MRKRRFWKEVYAGNYTLYCGFLSKGDWRIGASLGNENGFLELFNFTLGYMKNHFRMNDEKN